MKQFQAGYILDNIIESFDDNSSERNEIKELAKWCSHFQFESKSKFEENKVKYPSNVAVIINLIERGLPTRLNKYAFDFLIDKSTMLAIDMKDEQSLKIDFKNTTNDFKDIVFRSLHLIDPLLKVNEKNKYFRKSWEKLDSKYEEDFFYDTLPDLIDKQSGKALKQLLACQRTINSIIDGRLDETEKFSKFKSNFKEQRTDFSLEFPYNDSGSNKGVVIEIDGQHHNTEGQVYLDYNRDKAVSESGWHRTLRIKTSDFGNGFLHQKINDDLKPAINNKYVNTCLRNYSNPIWDTASGKEILQLSLIPFAIARIQRAILEAIVHKRIDNNKQELKIAIIERDVPCGKLAVEDLSILIKSLNVLSKDKLNLPKFILQTFSSETFINSQFQNSDTNLISKFNSEEFFDVVIDIAILDRTTLNAHVFSNSPEIITIRSVHYLEAKRKVHTSDLINYKPFCKLSDESGNWEITDKDIEKALVYLLQSIFRKKTFRPGQLPILHNSLQCKSVIGLLPTGGGKSLTYQISAFLQPGICLIIDPIRSLMKDQVDGLKKNYIDSCLYINSTIKSEDKRKALQKMTDAEVQFVFVSPERLQMLDFRKILDDMLSENIFFSYCVIDEAHCVSEWGHDFRTAYLNLGENAIKYCKTKNKASVPIFGLTATASYDVLADVQRELSGNDEKNRLTEEAIVRSEFTKRNELQYLIKTVHIATQQYKDFWVIRKILGLKKQEVVKEMLNDIPYSIDKYQNNPLYIFKEEDWIENKNDEKKAFENLILENYKPENFYLDNENAGIIFCPHKKGYFGVTDKFTLKESEKERNAYYDVFKKRKGIRAVYFMGSANEGDSSEEQIQNESFKNQDEFLKGNANLMVATKAFGMGIDKENVRYTIHVNYPASIESYVQEAGRAGRDGKTALSYILFNDQSLPVENGNNIDNDYEVNMYFHDKSFKGIEKETSILDELLTEVYFPDKRFELEIIIKDAFEVNVSSSFFQTGELLRLYFNLGYNEPLGYLDLIALDGHTNYWRQGQRINSVNPELSEQIWAKLVPYIQSECRNESVHEWLMQTDRSIGIESLIQSKNYGEEFKLTVGFFNDTKKRIEQLTIWLKKTIHDQFDDKTVYQIQSNAKDAKVFIENVCKKFNSFSNGSELNFEEACKKRDIRKGNPIGHAFNYFKKLYNGYRDKNDTEKAIYRLSTLGVIDDYSVDYAKGVFELIGFKKDENEYFNNLRRYLRKYYSIKTTQLKLEKLQNFDKSKLLRGSINFLVEFIDENIRRKRLQSIKDIRNACQEAVVKQDSEPYWLKEYIDLYFNSKYARQGYSYLNKKGVKVEASLSDKINNGKSDKIEYVWFFMKVIEEDESGGSEIDNIKHLRGACVRMNSSISEPSFSVKILNAFTLYMLEYNNIKYLIEAEQLLIDAFTILQYKFPRMNNHQLKKVFTTFVNRIINKNDNLQSILKMHNMDFDFNKVMIAQLFKPLQTINQNLNAINNILNT